MLTWTLRGCALLLAATMAFAAWSGFTENRAFAARGQRALVEPIAQYTTRTTTTKNPIGVTVNEQSANSAELFFTDGAGRRVRISRFLPDDVLAKFTAGSPVYVDYLPDAPQGARFAGTSARSFLPAVAGVVTVALTALLWRRF